MMRRSQSRASLFGRLDHDAFTIFAGVNRHLYEHVVLAIYRGFFQSDSAFPTEADVVGMIYGCFAAQPGLWIEDEAPVDLDRLVTRGGRRLRRRRIAGADDGATGMAITRSRHVYNRLRETGWLEESRYGLKVTVDMPAGAMRLAEFLCSLRDGASEQLGGLIVEVRNAVEGARAFPAEKALGLNKAARDAAAFGRYLRSVLSALRDIDHQVVKAGSLGERLRHYFENFVERVLLRDYSAIATTARMSPTRRSSPARAARRCRSPSSSRSSSSWRAVVGIGEMDVDTQDRELSIRALIATLAGDDFVASLDQIVVRPVADEEEPAS